MLCGTCYYNKKIKVENVAESAKSNKCPDVSGPALHQWIVRQCLKSRLLVFDLKVALCTRVLRTSDELKISIEAARLSCPETKDETHLLPLPLFVTIAEFDPANQRVRSGMSVRTEILCDGKTGHLLRFWHFQQHSQLLFSYGIVMSIFLLALLNGARVM